MKVIARNTGLEAQHGVICDYRSDFFGYFAWPSVARNDDGVIYVGASGLRHAHIGPFGRNVLFASSDEGRTWTSPRVINDSPLDDRDTGVVCFPGGRRLLVSWFTADMRRYMAEHGITTKDATGAARVREGLEWVTEEAVDRWFGSWIRLSEDAGWTWSDPIRSPLTAPHGPVLLSDGRLLYFGKVFAKSVDKFGSGEGAIRAAESRDGGRSWSLLGSVPLYPGTSEHNYHEPHMVELSGGRLLGLIRVQDKGEHTLEAAGIVSFSLAQTISTDGGLTFSPAQPLGFHGSPPHLLRHSGGTLVAVYGYRLRPYGERVAISRDQGETWEYDYILRDDGPDHDLGYPASVELADGSILTIYYQKITSEKERCSLQYSRWHLPEKPASPGP